MSFIENNPRFRAWAGDSVSLTESGFREYGRCGLKETVVSVRNDGRFFSMDVFMSDRQTNPDGAGERAAEWFDQFFAPQTTSNPSTETEPGLDDVTWEGGW